MTLEGQLDNLIGELDQDALGVLLNHAKSLHEDRERRRVELQESGSVESAALRGKLIERATILTNTSNVYALKHHIAAEYWEWWRDWIGLPVAILSGLTSAAAFSQLPYSGPIAGALALLITLMISVTGVSKTC